MRKYPFLQQVTDQKAAARVIREKSGQIRSSAALFLAISSAVEHVTVNHAVVGSIPTLPAKQSTKQVTFLRLASDAG